jgi:hypothetical protein
MNSASSRKTKLQADGEQLIDDLIKDAKQQGLLDAAKTLEEFKEMLKNKDVLG